MDRIVVFPESGGFKIVEKPDGMDKLKFLQDSVGGYIKPFNEVNCGFTICLLCDEDARLKERPKNKTIAGIYGDVAVVAVGDEDFEFLTDEEVSFCRMLYNFIARGKKDE